MNQPQPPKKQITIDLPPEAAEGVYANLTIIASNPSEFVLDFARLLPGAPKAKVNEKPPGETVDYDKLIQAWREGRVK